VRRFESVAIIPARGGSKRIPNKNIRLFNGKPIIAYSIEAAKASGLFEKIVVSTDSEEIASVAEKFGAEVPFRRKKELADDFAATAPVIIDALKELEKINISYRYVCCLYATAPLVRVEDIRAGFTALITTGASGSFSVTKFAHPIFRAMRVNGQGRLEMFWPEHRLTRSNDLPEAFHDAGQFYWREVASFQRDQSLWAADAVPIILPQKWAQDIDSLADWERAELLFQMREQADSNDKPE